jgi:hypothetical protein
MDCGPAPDDTRGMTASEKRAANRARVAQMRTGPYTPPKVEDKLPTVGCSYPMERKKTRSYVAPKDRMLARLYRQRDELREVDDPFVAAERDMLEREIRRLSALNGVT